MYKKILLSTLGGAVTLFLIGGLIYGFLLADYMAEQMAAGKACMNAEMSLGIIGVINIVQALLLSLVIDKFGISTWQSGAVAGAWITFLMIIWFDLWMLASFNFMPTSFILIDVVINTIFGAAAGAVIGLILGKVN